MLAKDELDELDGWLQRSEIDRDGEQERREAVLENDS